MKAVPVNAALATKCPCGSKADFMVEVRENSGLFAPKCSAHVECAMEIASRLSDEEVGAIQDAADVLDALWDLEAAMGTKDSQGGAEYWRRALGPKLRRIIGEAEPE